jgi:type II secretory pathway component GspD/PulD (secretin)
MKIKKWIALSLCAWLIASNLALAAIETPLLTPSLDELNAKSKVKTISISVRDADLSSVLQTFSSETGINIIAGKDVGGKVSVSLNGVKPMDALTVILKANGYSFVKEGDILRIVPATGILSERFIKTFTINYADIDELQSELVKLVPSLKDKVLTGKASNSLIINSNDPEIGRIAEIIKQLDEPPMQVLVEAKIFEMSLTNESSFGIKWRASDQNNAGNFVQSPGLVPANAQKSSGLFVQVLEKSVQAYLDALETRTDYDLLSCPKIMVLNNKEASLINGENIGYKVQTTSTSTGGTVVADEIRFLKTGTSLVFTPHISKDGYIQLDLYPRISDGIINPDTKAPDEKTTEARTRVIVRDGQTFIIGGLVRDKVQETITQVPGLGDLPLLGSLFKSKTLSKTKKEIVVMVTPHIVDATWISSTAQEVKAVDQKKDDFEKSKKLID